MGAELEQSLIELARGFGPWFAAGVMIFLARKEILALLTASRNDGAVEKLLIAMNGLLTEMNRQFAANMEMFHVTNGHLSAIHELIGQSTELQTKILVEMARGQR